MNNHRAFLRRSLLACFLGFSVAAGAQDPTVEAAVPASADAATEPAAVPTPHEVAPVPLAAPASADAATVQVAASTPPDAALVPMVVPASADAATEPVAVPTPHDAVPVPVAASAPPDAAPIPAAAPLAAAKIRVEASHDGLFADGHGALAFSVAVLDRHGAPAADGVLCVTATGGTILDADRRPLIGADCGVRFSNGRATFSLVAPATPGEITLRLSVGEAHVEGVLTYLPEVRDMVAVGVIEGVIGKRTLRAGSIVPAHFDDGFEREIQHWARRFGDNFNAAGRIAFFLKGQIKGDALLTAAYDSDKDTRQKLAQSIDPNAIYPVYGDDSIVGFEALSSDRLFVRIDKNKSYLLYGDYSTTGTTPVASSVAVANTAVADPVLLGRYNRTATGLRGHYESGRWTADAFVIDDTLKQVVEEYPANGTSGPYAVKNGNAVQNSERVEVIVRDKNQRGIVKNVTTLIRYVDYAFEPFSGRILLNRPLPTLSPEGDPVSLKISYEVDQGGERFFTYGASGKVRVAEHLDVGASDVEDKNPLAPYRLTSANADWLLSENLRVIVEAARTTSTLYSAGGNTYAVPSGQSGETGTTATGDAARVEFVYKGERGDARLWWVHADHGFENTSSGVAPGREDAGAKARLKLTDSLESYAEYAKTDDTVAETGRHAVRVGISDQVGPRLKIDLSLRRIHDNSGFPAETLIAPNAAAPGAANSTSGGFFGSGTSTTVIDPLTGAPINTLAPTGTATGPSAGHDLDATTVRLGATWQATDKTTVDAGVEKSVDGEDRHAADIGATYAVSDLERLYARAETQTGLASANALVAADRSNSFVAGMTRELTAETRLFSEYRLVNAWSDNAPPTFDQMLANGLRNQRRIGEGITLTNTAEYLKVLSASQRDAVAVASAIDYGAAANWKGAAKLEFRRLSDDRSAPGDQAEDQWLSTLAFARKLDADWTLLAKNYLLIQRRHDDASGLPTGNTRQERFLTGFAWRPTAHNQVNALARYEYKNVSDLSQPLGDRYVAHIASATMDYRPRPGWWASGRVAFKRNTDYTLPAADQAFDAWLLSGRFTVDVSDKIDVGVMAGTLRQNSGGATRNAWGVEGGYRLARNLWGSLGYNWSGFSDRDLAASDYTERGVFLRLRAKFDEKSLPF